MTTELLTASSRPARASTGAVQNTRTNDRRGLSVLVVDDSEDTAQSFAELLTLCGHAARIACCGPDAIRSAAAEAPDVVLLDIGLPGMDGWEVARRLRAQAVGKQPLLVAVTGHGAPADRMRSADAGIDLHLLKPAAPDAVIRLLAWVRDCLVGRGPARVRRTDSRADGK